MLPLASIIWMATNLSVTQKHWSLERGLCLDCSISMHWSTLQQASLHSNKNNSYRTLWLDCAMFVFLFQESVQHFLVIVIVICIPWLLVPKPFLLWRRGYTKVPLFTTSMRLLVHTSICVCISSYKGNRIEFHVIYHLKAIKMLIPLPPYIMVSWILSNIKL